jgi:hypothetical protein
VDNHEASDDEDADPVAVVAAAGHTFYFGPSTVTENRIREFEKLKYFAEGDGRALRKETVQDPKPDEAAVFVDYFIVWLRIPLHSGFGRNTDEV